VRAIITGGAGFVGSHLACSLLSGGHEVAIVDNLHTGSLGNVPKGAKFLEADAKDIGKTGMEPDAIFHLGIYSSTPMYRDNRSLVAKAIESTIGVLDYATKCECPAVIASSSSVYNGNRTPFSEDMTLKVTDFYTEARIAVERLGELYSIMYGLPVTSLRFFSIYGLGEESKGRFANPVSQFIWSARKHERPVIYGDGQQTRDFIHVDDVIDALLRAPGKSGAFNVGTGKSHAMNDILRIIGGWTEMNIEPIYRPVPFKNYVRDTLANTLKASSELGFSAKIKIEEGIRGLVERRIVA
jgi:UDP-glucose 4-epimerase